jgi:beta-glucanase (GH16 family)
MTPASPAATSTQAAPPPLAAMDPPVAGTWTQVFGDEFDGTGIDPTRWRRNRYGGTSDNGAFNPKYEDAYYSPHNVSVAEGVATLTMQPDPKTVEGVSYTHSSGCLSSQGRFMMEDGDFIEARLWLPSGGVWPAFWTVPDDRWPPEIDIAENLDTAASSLPEFVYHAADGSRTYGFYGEPSVDYRDSWHTYGLLRSHGAVIPYVDGVAYPKIGVSAGGDDLAQFIILNLASMEGRAPAAPVQMKIDFLRVWRPA